MNLYIKGLVINKEEYMTKNEQGKQANEEGSWGFQSRDDIFQGQKSVKEGLNPYFKEIYLHLF